MSNEPNKPAELTEKELEGIVGGMTEKIEAIKTEDVMIEVKKKIEDAMIEKAEMLTGGTAEVSVQCIGGKPR